MPSIDKLRHNIRHAVSLSAFSPNLIHRIRYFFLYTVTFRDYSMSAKRYSIAGRISAASCSSHSCSINNSFCFFNPSVAVSGWKIRSAGMCK